MYELKRLLATAGLAAGLTSGLTVSGCTAESDPPAPGVAHDHDGDGVADHGDEAHGGAGGDEADGHGMTPEAREIGSVIIGRTTMSVAVVGTFEPNALVNVDLTVTAGPVPPSVRLWIGDRAGIGALKSRAGGHDDHFHGSAEAPATIGADTMLWIEVESLDGSGGMASIELN